MTIDEMIRLAELLAKSKAGVPKSLFGDVAGVTAVLLTGQELGLGPMESLRSLHVIDGRITPSADLVLSLAAKKGVRWTWIETSNEVATIEIARDGEVVGTMTWTTKDAERAGLLGRSGWRQYPAAMLRARAATAAIRAFCPDVIGAGIYAAEELDDFSPTEEVNRQKLEAPKSEAPKSLRECESAEQVIAWCHSASSKYAEWSDEKRASAKSALARKCEETSCDFDAAFAALTGDAK